MKQYKSTEKLELKNIAKDFPKVFKKVYCPSCEEEASADNLNLQNNIAKCGSCNVIFSIEEEVASVKQKKNVRQEVLRPEGIDLFYYKDDLDITIQQHIQTLDTLLILLLSFASFFSILLYFKKGILIYYPMAFTLGALYFIYKALFYNKNKTYIDINDKFLNIRSRPKNFQQDKTYAADDIDQLYIKQLGEGIEYYTIHMIVNSLEGQKHETLLTVNTLSKAKYLEQTIEDYLGIEQREVPEANA